jgi:DNA-binding transcriptional ArsR family regulator
MPVTSAKLLLHPVRLRILEAFLGDRKLTTADLRSDLDDISAASLYRHVAFLVDGGVLDVVAERRVRGAVERTYVLRRPTRVTDDVLKMTPDEHKRAFFGYVAALIADFDRYVSQPGADLLRDGVGYRIAAMWLDDAELTKFIKQFANLVQPLVHNPPTPGRKRRILRTVLLPGTGLAASS